MERSLRLGARLSALAVLALGVAALPGQATAGDLIVNGSFETGNFNGWDTSHFGTPGVRTVPDPGSFFATTPTDGNRAAGHAFDGEGPGTIEISQVVEIPAGTKAILTFDWRAAWAMESIWHPTIARTFDVIIEPASGGAALQTTNILTAAPLTTNSDTGPQSATIDLSAFAGQSIRIRLSAYIPESYTGPGQLQIDNVALNVTEAPVDPEDPVATGPTDAEIAERTQRAIRNFAVRRADHITANETSMAYRLLDRGRQAGGPVSFTGDGGSASGFTGEATFSTSLQQMRSSRQASEDQSRNQIGRMMGLGMGGDGSVAAPSRFDVWVRGTWADADSFGADSAIGLFYLGADYKLSDNLLVGIMSQMDWTDEHDGGQGVDGEGQGWLIGPYVVMRLHDNLVFDGSARFGRADNSITMHNAYASTGSYDSDRWLVTGTLTGDFDIGRFNIAPSASLLYFEEDQDAFTNSLGIDIPGQSISLGRFTFGPKISTSLTASDGTVVSPFVTVKGLWDFDRTRLTNLTTGLAAGTDEVRARIESGASFQLTGGLLLTGEGFYDGIGASDFEAYGGSARLNLPLN